MYNVIQQLKKAEQTMDAMPEQLKSLSGKFDRTIAILEVIKKQKELHTEIVQQNVVAVTEDCKVLQSYMDRLSAEIKHRKVRQLFHALVSGEEDKQELDGILNSIEQSRNGLHTSISVALVSLVGDIKKGSYGVSFNALINTNRGFRNVTGDDLQLVKQLNGRQPDSDGYFKLNTADLEQLGLTAGGCQRQSTFHDNKTRGKATVYIDTFAKKDEVAVPMDMYNNEFGPELRVVAAHFDPHLAMKLFS
ncbi:hypothetical protein BDV25DRAFT_140306 [Aspergillus avenaceus]|uniref:Uncharacterized protein n=1 Tax=Aspergillus avenaceus TaxID=36643 RepID=A0A5N6TU86_ASPAV|nr:hypothetical protein BDV25DRAFT_140306 [Aspergillus avenaceus]